MDLHHIAQVNCCWRSEKETLLLARGGFVGGGNERVTDFWMVRIQERKTFMIKG